MSGNFFGRAVLQSCSQRNFEFWMLNVGLLIYCRAVLQSCCLAVVLSKEFWMLNVEFWIVELLSCCLAVVRSKEFWILNFEFWIVELLSCCLAVVQPCGKRNFGCWILDFGFLIILLRCGLPSSDFLNRFKSYTPLAPASAKLVLSRVERLSTGL